MDLVSIITPAYNASPFIAETIKSVINQTYTNWEMIIIDDCSNDDTFQIACEFSDNDSRIRVIKNKYNQGVAATRNNGLIIARGKYIAFLDSDDLWVANKLEKQICFMEKNDYILTYTAYQQLNSITGNISRMIKVPKKMTYNTIFYNTAIACLTVIINKEKSGDFEMPLIGHTEDQCTWQSILKKGYEAYGLNENLATYRVGINSLTSNKIKAVKGQWYTYRQYYKLGFVKSLFYFTLYAFNALVKHRR